MRDNINILERFHALGFAGRLLRNDMTTHPHDVVAFEPEVAEQILQVLEGEARRQENNRELDEAGTWHAAIRPLDFNER